MTTCKSCQRVFEFPGYISFTDQAEGDQFPHTHYDPVCPWCDQPLYYVEDEEEASAAKEKEHDKDATKYSKELRKKLR